MMHGRCLPTPEYGLQVAADKPDPARPIVQDVQRADDGDDRCCRYEVLCMYHLCM